MFDRIKNLIIEQMDIDADRIHEDTSFIDDLGADSLDLVDLLVTLEDELGMSIPQEAVKDVRTIGELVDVIENLK
ncbi:MAG: acyl carrier protein [bacterium]